MVRLTRRRVLPSQCKVKIVRIGTGECAVEVFYETKNISVAKDNYIETKGSVVIEVTLTHPVVLGLMLDEGMPSLEAIFTS